MRDVMESKYEVRSNDALTVKAHQTETNNVVTSGVNNEVTSEVGRAMSPK